jgi:hypothetical protein
MKRKRNVFQPALAVLFGLLLIIQPCNIPAQASHTQLFFTPSVEPLEVESTPMPLSPGKPDPAEASLTSPAGISGSDYSSLQPGELYTSTSELPALTGRIGTEDFGIGSVAGREDLAAIWVTRDGETRYLLVSADNPALYGIRDPVTDMPIGTGYVSRLKDWQELRRERIEIMAENAGSISSAVGSGASAFGGLAAGSPTGIVGGITGAFDVISGMVERYINGGVTYFTMKDAEHDLANLFDEAYRIEIQAQGGLQ